MLFPQRGPTIAGMQTKQMIAVIEDDPAIAQAISARLASEGFAVELAGDGPAAVALCERIDPALVILDVMLPGFDGLEACRRIQRNRPVPVLMLTARDTETDIVVGLAVGADDYLTKPFSPRELVARVRAMLRRAERLVSSEQQISADDARLALGDIELDVAARLAHRSSAPVHLTTTEFDLARWFLSHPNVVYTREQLLMQVWGYADGSGERTVDSHVQALRQKLGREFVRTAHGFGYALGSGAAA